MISENKPALIADLRFALDVMDAHSHLGLDSEYHSRLRSLLLDQIADEEATIPVGSKMETVSAKNCRQEDVLVGID